MCYVKNRVGLMSLLQMSIAPDNAQTSANKTDDDACVSDRDVKMIPDNTRFGGNGYAVTSDKVHAGSND